MLRWEEYNGETEFRGFSGYLYASVIWAFTGEQWYWELRRFAESASGSPHGYCDTVEEAKSTAEAAFAAWCKSAGLGPANCSEISNSSTGVNSPAIPDGSGSKIIDGLNEAVAVASGKTAVMHHFHVPEGWKLVPKVATLEMVLAVAQSIELPSVSMGGPCMPSMIEAERHCKAMLAAAPEPDGRESDAEIR